MNYFLHGSKIVGAFYRFDVEFSIVFLAGFSIFKHHAGSYGIRALNVAVVKTFNVAGFFTKAQVLFHLGHDAIFMPIWVNNLGLFETFHAVILGIAL